jgi:hypothetical protein
MDEHARLNACPILTKTETSKQGPFENIFFVQGDMVCYRCTVMVFGRMDEHSKLNACSMLT